MQIDERGPSAVVPMRSISSGGVRASVGAELVSGMPQPVKMSTNQAGCSESGLPDAAIEVAVTKRGRKPETRTIEGTARRGTGTASSGRLSRIEGQAMPIRWRTRGYERTCDDCGHVWRVPRWAAPPLHVQGRPVSGDCEGGVPPPAAAVMADPAVAATAQLAERAAVFFRRCRECGSERYKQRSIWSWTDDPGC